MVPAFVQGVVAVLPDVELSVRLPPLLDWIAPVFDQLTPLRIMVPPATSELIVPWLMNVWVPRSIEPFLPCTRMLGPSVSAAEPEAPRPLPVLPPNSTAPVPPRVCVPWKSSRPMVGVVVLLLPRLMTALLAKVSPLVTVAVPEALARAWLADSVTPLRVLPDVVVNVIPKLTFACARV